MSTGILVSTFAPPTFTKWSSRITNSVYSLISATASTARPAILWIPIRSSSGLHPRVAGDRITRICERSALRARSKFQVPSSRFNSRFGILELGFHPVCRLCSDSVLITQSSLSARSPSEQLPVPTRERAERSLHRGSATDGFHCSRSLVF